MNAAAPAATFRLWSASADVRAWSVSDTPGGTVSTALPEALPAERRAVAALALSADGERIATVGADTGAHLYRPSGQRTDILAPSPAAAQAPDAGIAADAASRGVRPDPWTTALFGHGDTAQRLYLGSQSGTLYRYDCARRQFEPSLTHAPGPITVLCANADASRVAAGGVHGACTMFSVETATTVPLVPASPSRVAGLQFYPFKRSWLMGAGEDGSVFAWDLHRQQSPAWLRRRVHDGAVTDLACAPCNKHLLFTIGEDRSLVLQSVLSQGRRINRLVLDAMPTRIAVSDATQVAIGTDAGTVLFYDIRMHRIAAEMPAHRGPVTALAFQPPFWMAAPPLTAATGIVAKETQVSASLHLAAATAARIAPPPASSPPALLIENPTPRETGCHAGAAWSVSGSPAAANPAHEADGASPPHGWGRPASGNGSGHRSPSPHSVLQRHAFFAARATPRSSVHGTSTTASTASLPLSSAASSAENLTAPAPPGRTSGGESPTGDDDHPSLRPASTSRRPVASSPSTDASALARPTAAATPTGSVHRPITIHDGNEDDDDDDPTPRAAKPPLTALHRGHDTASGRHEIPAPSPTAAVASDRPLLPGPVTHGGPHRDDPAAAPSNGASEGPAPQTRPLATRGLADPLSPTTPITAAMAAASPAPRLQYRVLDAMLQDSLDALRHDLRQDLQNIQLDMLDQFQRQREEMVALVEMATAPARELAEQVRSLTLENAMLREQMGRYR
ncbi:hypothetical protein CXG81DRAFT_20670 [Caulochytrium protostelioides]|uniref:WD40 repeat-like protein n=1 Tax=Caulochytrium protostelioides TaxID=1555241 RepID=A0A4P9WZQ6_9FUNG|nr:WD40 repeat-like protein [Caulochytrium protostelioides]RKO99219.1 hypothetical protein CXG81DRAFT_20670 [Caulochytrium protostelioides]|eukprot:RKO99219.1 hypothetical protein CXG81DRAFT_20670 [Caulochytrium protostelioides]